MPVNTAHRIKIRLRIALFGMKPLIWATLAKKHDMLFESQHILESVRAQGAVHCDSTSPKIQNMRGCAVDEQAHRTQTVRIRAMCVVLIA